MRSFAFLAISILVVMASGQAPSDYHKSFQPFQNPGEIAPGLTIKFLINAAGGIWQQDRVIDALAYVCRGVLPVVGSGDPELDLLSVYWGSICDGVIEASEDQDAFNTTGFCNDIIKLIRIIKHFGGREAKILTNISRNLYGIDINMIINDPSTINTICTNVKGNILEPSVKHVIYQIFTELVSVLLPQAAPICQDWQGFLADKGIDSSSPYYNIIQDGARIGSQAVGYDNREDLCQHIEQALLAQGDNNAARRAFSENIISNILAIKEEVDTCSALANDVIDNVFEPSIRHKAPGFVIPDDVVLTYTGIDGGVGAVCRTLKNGFTYEIDLPDPVPYHVIYGTTLTVDFFLNAAGGIWQQDRLIDSLAFVCTDVLPELESMVPEFKTFVQDSWDYKPVCGRIRDAASNLEAFDATEFCEDLTKIVNDLGDGGIEMIRRQVNPSMLSIFDIGKVANITRDLYSIDIINPSTICPNIAQFLDRSIPDIISEFGAKLMAVFLPNIDFMLCKDSQQLNQANQNTLHIASQVVGYESRQALCQEIERVLAITGYDNEERRTFTRNIIESSFEIYTNNGRCSMLVNDFIDDVIELEPMFESENFPFKISDYTIYRFTGYMGVKEVCEALETAFTKLSTRTVKMTLTGETDDLKNLASRRFKELQTLYCGMMKNHLKHEFGSDLRNLDCVATSFSIIAELEIEMQAYTPDIADSLAEDAVDLSTSGTLILSSSDGDTLAVSSLQGSDIDNCSPDPCMRGGTCTDGVGTFTCACVAGYSGSLCETDIDNCSPDPCMGRGYCINGVDTFTCACIDGYTGSMCETIELSLPAETGRGGWFSFWSHRKHCRSCGRSGHSGRLHHPRLQSKRREGY